MTSRKSFSKLLLLSLKDHIWSATLSFITFFLAMPVYAALYITMIKDRLLNGQYTADILPRVFRRDVLGEGNTVLIMAIMFVATIIAINGFSFVFSKSKVDMYHSLPVKRELLFVTNLLAGVLTYLVPYIIFMLLTFIVAFSRGLLDITGVLTALLTLVINLLGFLGVYFTVVLAIMLTGKLMVSILAIGVFFFYFPALNLVLEMCMNKFFITMSYRSYDAPLLNISPLFFFVRLHEGMQSFYGKYELSAKIIIGYIVVVAALGASSCALYKFRQSEAAGKSIAFAKSMPYISILLLIPTAIYGGLGFESIAEQNGRINYGWLIFGTLITMLIAHFVIQAIYYSDFRSLFKNLINPAIALVAAAVIMSVFIFDILGHDRYIPKEKNFESAAIASYAFQSGMSYYDLDNEYDEFGYRNIWVDSIEYRLEHTEITDYNLVNAFVKRAMDENKTYHQLIRQGEDIDYNNTAYAEVDVMYTLNSGKKVFRTYNIDLMACMDIYDSLYRTEEYKEGVFEILSLSDDDLCDFVFANAMGPVKTDYTKAQIRDLIDAYRTDLMNQTAYDLQKEVPVGCLYQSFGIDEPGGYRTEYKRYQTYIYPSFTRTISLLEQYGTDMNKYLDVSNVEKIVIHNYHYENDIMAEAVGEEMNTVDTKEYTDREDIRRIYECAVPMEMADIDGMINKSEELSVEITFKETSVENRYPLTFVFKKGQVPDFVRTDLNYNI